MEHQDEMIRVKECLQGQYGFDARPHGRLAQTATWMFSMNKFRQETKDKTPSLMRVIPKKIHLILIKLK